MFENNQIIEEVKQNMKDAGYTKEEIDAFIPVWQSGNKAESMKLLSKQRKLLLQSIHRNQEDIECLEGLLATVRG